MVSLHNLDLGKMIKKRFAPYRSPKCAGMLFPPAMFSELPCDQPREYEANTSLQTLFLATGKTDSVVFNISMLLRTCSSLLLCSPSLCKLFFMTLTSHPSFPMLLGAGPTNSCPTNAPVLRPTHHETWRHCVILCFHKCAILGRALLQSRC